MGHRMLPADERSRLQEILREAYGMQGCTISPMPLGMMNHGYRVEYAGRAYFLKAYLRKYQHDRISRACEVQAIVRRAGVPVPELIPNLAGESVTESRDGVCTLSEYVVGRSFARPNVPKEAASSMGRALGRIHETLEAVGSPLPFEVPDAGESRAMLEGCLALAEANRSRSRVDELSCEVLRYKLASLECLAYLAPELSRLQTQLTHGDFQETNVLFAIGEGGPGRLVAVLDFDYAGHQPRGAEITRCLTLCFLDGDTLLPEAWDFVSGYAEVLRLPEDEVRLFAPLRAYLSATGAWPITDRYFKPEAYQARWDRFIRPPSGWWQAHAAEMTERLVRVMVVR